MIDGCKSILVGIKKLTDTARLPQYKTDGAAGFDLYADCPEGLLLEPGKSIEVSIGIASHIPVGWQVSIRPRSGLAFQYGVTIGNSPGTIDSDYRGCWKVLLISHGDRPIGINHGDRVAQGILEPVWTADFFEVAELQPTARSGGFGSTGR